MKKKLSWILVTVILLTLVSGTAALAAPDIGGGNAQPADPGTGYPQYPDEYYDIYGGASNESTVTLEVVGDMGLRVLVTETDGVTPIEDADISIETVSSGTLLAAVTNENGIAFIELPRPGLDPDSPDGELLREEYLFSVSKEGYLPQENISVFFDGHTVEEHVLLQRAAQEFTFLVIDEDGAPVQGASIDLYHFTSGSQTGNGKTGADGKLVLTLPVASHRYEITHPDFLGETGRVTCGPDGGSCTIKLRERFYETTVRAVDKETRNGIPDVTVRTPDGMTLQSRADGTIPFEGGKLAAGVHQVNLIKEGYVTLRNYKFTVEKRDGQEILIEMESTKKNISPNIVPDISPDGGGSGIQEAAASISEMRNVNRTVDVEACIMDTQGRYIEDTELEFLPEDLKLSSDENGRAVFHDAGIGEHTINAEKDGQKASMDFELMIGSKPDLISGEHERVVITEDMQTVTLYLELDGDTLRLAGFTKESMQDDQLLHSGGAVPYTENAVLDQDSNAAANSADMVLAGTGLLWMLLVLLAILIYCMIAVYVYRREQEKRYESLQN